MKQSVRERKKVYDVIDPGTHSMMRKPPIRQAVRLAASAFVVRGEAAAMYPSSGPKAPFAPDAPGKGAPPWPPPLTFVGAVGSGLEDVDDEEDVEAFEEEPLPPVVIASTVEKTEVDTMVVSTLFPPLTMMVGIEEMAVETMVVNAVEAGADDDDEAGG